MLFNLFKRAEMPTVLFLIGVVLGVIAAETENSDIVKRLDATEELVRTLIDEVENLKSKTELQTTQIADLEIQNHYQQQRNSHLENMIRRLMAQNRRESYVKREITSVPKETIAHNRQESSVKRDITFIQEPKPDLHQGTPTSRIRRAETESTVAFFVRMGQNVEHAGVHQTIVFKDVVTNLGNAYNNHVGTFIAPMSGTYVFSTTLVSFYHFNAHAQFIKNGFAISTMFVSGIEAGYDSTSQTIVLQLQKGDDVCIQNLDSDKSFIGADHSTFSGFLLQEDISSASIVGK